MQKHPKLCQEDFKLTVNPISQSWQEGDGLDLENFSDLTYNNEGSNWLSASNAGGWTNDAGNDLIGGSIITSSEDHQ
jgi:hypothetical protein